jgi:CubicO group peptidase (beta-lactamase class C family)
VRALEQVGDWPAPNAAVSVVGVEGPVGRTGPHDRAFALASVTKLLTAVAVLVAVEEETLRLDEAAGPEGATVRHLLAHASGLGPDGGVLAPPAQRRIYSNAGFEVLASALEDRAGLPFRTYLHEAVLEPLGMATTVAAGSPAHGAESTVSDLERLAAELLSPTLVAAATMDVATGVAFAGLDGVLPGFGPQEPNDWGLGFEIRGTKSPHWTGATSSPRTFGHFGRSGTFLWVDPDVQIACVCLTDLDFGPWAARAWPTLTDAVVEEIRE